MFTFVVHLDLMVLVLLKQFGNLLNLFKENVEKMLARQSNLQQQQNEVKKLKLKSAEQKNHLVKNPMKKKLFNCHLVKKKKLLHLKIASSS